MADKSTPAPDPYGMIGGQDRLFAKLNRLQAEVDRLRAREGAAMAIVRAVANLGIRPWANQDFIADFSEWCAWCGATHLDEHTADCPVTKARALLAEK